MNHSITELIEALRSKDEEATFKLYDKCYQRIAGQGRKAIHGIPTKTFDEEDVANSVFREFFDRVSLGHFTKLENRDDVWQILTLLVGDKIAERLMLQNRQKRGKGWERQSLEAIANTISELDDPAIQAMTNDALSELKRNLLSDDQRQIIDCLMEGMTQVEIASKLGMSIRTVSRRIEGIREALSRILGITQPKTETDK